MSRVLGFAVAALFVMGFAVAGGDPKPQVELTFQDPEIVEASGLVARDDLFVTANDSGDSGRVFTVDRDGRTVGVTSWGDAVDVEAVAPAGRGQVLVGDIGDNTGVRDSVRLLRVPVGRGDRDVTPTAYDVVYPDGPQDAESLLVHPVTGQVLIVTKGVFGGKVMAAPRRLSGDGDNELTAVGSVIGIATDGAFFPDGKHLVIRDYSSAVVYSWPDLEVVGKVPLPQQPQGEGIAIDEDGAVFVSSEGAQSEVLRISLPAWIRQALDPPPDSAPTTSTAPSSAGGADPVGDEPLWPWLLGGGVGAVVIVVLLRSLRPR